MKNKKMICALLLALSVVALLCGCGAEKEQEKPWAEEAAKNVPTEIDVENGGQIYIKDHAFDFPMKVSELLENGWEYSNNYKDLKGSMVKPGYQIKAFEMYREEDPNEYIQIAVYNPGEEEISIDNALITLVSSGFESCEEFMVSGGIYIRQPEEDFLKVVEALGEDAFKDDEDESDSSYCYYIPFIARDEYTCCIAAEVFTVGEPFVGKIKMYFIDEGSNYDREISDYADYVNAHMENDYHANSSFLEDTYYVDGSSCYESQQATTEYIAEAIYAYAGLEAKTGDLLTMESHVRSLLSGATWEVQEKDGQIVINITYPNTTDIIETAYDAASKMDGDLAANFTTCFSDAFAGKAYNNTTTARYTIDEEEGVTSDAWSELALIVAGLIQQEN